MKEAEDEAKFSARGRLSAQQIDEFDKAAQAVRASILMAPNKPLALEYTLRPLAEENKKLSNILQRFGWIKSKTNAGFEFWHFETWPNPQLEDLLAELEEER